MQRPEELGSWFVKTMRHSSLNSHSSTTMHVVGDPWKDTCSFRFRRLAWLPPVAHAFTGFIEHGMSPKSEP